MAIVVRSTAVEDTLGVGRSVAPLLRPRDVVLLSGDLGAGKTTLTRGVVEGLGADEHVQSPTFVLVREYLSGRLPVAHVDVYRLQRIQDVVDLGLEELDGGSEGVVLVEWGDAVGDLWPGDHLRISLRTPDAGSEERLIALDAEGSSWRERWEDLERAVVPWREGAA